MKYSTVRLCAGGGAYEALPERRVALDLPRIAERLRADSVEVADARVLLLIQLEREVTLTRDGRIVIKTRDEPQAKRVCDDLLRRLGELGGPESKLAGPVARPPTNR